MKTNSSALLERAPSPLSVRPVRRRTAAAPERLCLAPATAAQREEIYRLRHDIYARELHQHHANAGGQLSDPLDAYNTYLVATSGGEIAGFVSITPPGQAAYSMDKYVPREKLPFACDAHLYEVRLLTVVKPHRGRSLAALLMYAAFRWIEARGGTRLMAIGRREVAELYLKAGLKPVGMTVQSGAVTFDVMQAEVSALRRDLARFDDLLARLENQIDWQLNIAFRKPAACFHGGAFFQLIGEKFDTLERRESIINADVLDAWFPPAPGVLQTLQAHLPWLLRTSPPTGCDGLREAIAAARGVTTENILPGGGSSDLIFLALRQWLTAKSKVLLLDPTYGEYAHVLEKVVGCRVDRLTLERARNYDVPLDKLAKQLQKNYDLVVLVNPNSPTGRHLDREDLITVLRAAPARTKIWVDETYIDYAGTAQSLESFAATSENVVVCKSMSKVYALSGARAAYLCASPHLLEDLRAITPPWAVSLPGQVAAVKALVDPVYYAARYRETHILREELAVALRGLRLEVVPGIANFLLCHLPPHLPTAAAIVTACRRRGLFLRDAAVMGSSLGDRALRIAVKDAHTNEKMVQILKEVLAARKCEG